MLRKFDENSFNKNAVDKSYFVEFSENLTTFVIECILVDFAMKDKTTAFPAVIWFNVC